MKILLANPIHLPMLVPLFDSYRVFYKQNSSVNDARKFLYERLKNKDSVIFLAIDSNNKGLGFTQLYPTFSSVSLERFYILNDLYVLSEARGKGIGEALLKRAQEYTTKLGYKGLALETSKDNPAQHLYERLGWVNDQSFLHYFWKK